MTGPVITVSPLLARGGNLTVVVGTRLNNEPKSLLFNAKSMCLASPMWNNIPKPEGYFLENGSKETLFRYDDPDAFEILL
jgi:hypothetical protein